MQNKKIIEYKIVTKTTDAELSYLVNSLIMDGWQPYGAAISGSEGDWVSQTMVIYDES